MKKLIYGLTLLSLITIPLSMAHAADPKAKRVRVTDAGGYYSGDNVEDVLQEVGASTIVAAPLNATYITQTANSTLTNEQALTSLSDGLIKVNHGLTTIEEVLRVTEVYGKNENEVFVENDK